MRPDELERRLQERLDALGPAPRHYSTEPELGDTYVLILPWRWRSSRNPMTEMPVVMCNEAPLGAKRHTPVPFDEDAARESFTKDSGVSASRTSISTRSIRTTMNRRHSKGP